MSFVSHKQIFNLKECRGQSNIKNVATLTNPLTSGTLSQISSRAFQSKTTCDQDCTVAIAIKPMISDCILYLVEKAHQCKCVYSACGNWIFESYTRFAYAHIDSRKSNDGQTMYTQCPALATSHMAGNDSAVSCVGTQQSQIRHGLCSTVVTSMPSLL
jgi:hypothetical protein